MQMSITTEHANIFSFIATLDSIGSWIAELSEPREAPLNHSRMMVRSRADNMDVDKLAKKDNKRHSTGKITKHERKNKASGRTGKPQLQIISDSSDDESSKVGLTSPKQAQKIELALRPYLPPASGCEI